MGIVMYLVIMFLSYRVHDISLDGESWIKLLIIRRCYHAIISFLSWINIQHYNVSGPAQNSYRPHISQTNCDI